MQVRDLRPLSDYEFQMRACSWRNTPRPGSAAGRRLLYSAWSQSARGRSPGKGNLTLIAQKQEGDGFGFVTTHKTDKLSWNLSAGPSHRLDVWRLLGGQTANGRWMVTVLWKVDVTLGFL